MVGRVHNPEAPYQIKVGFPQIGRVDDTWNIDGDAIGGGVFAVNKQMHEQEDGEMDYGKGWNVTHVPTGFAVVSNLPTRAVAVAVAEKLDALGWSKVKDSDPRVATDKLVKLGAIEFKTFILMETNAKVPPAKMVERVARWKRGARGTPARAKAAKRKPPKPSAPARKKPPKKTRTAKGAPKKKAAPKKKTRKAEKPGSPPAAAPGVDLLTMAKRARRGNPGDLNPEQAGAKQRCLW